MNGKIVKKSKGKKEGKKKKWYENVYIYFANIPLELSQIPQYHS